MKPIAIVAVLALTLALPNAQAQFGGLKNMVPGVAAVTVDTLMGDINSGMDFFGRAARKYEQALGISAAVHESNAASETADGKTGVQAIGIIASDAERIAAEAQARRARGEALSEEAKKLVNEGKAEVGKGIAKWAVLGVAIAKAKKDGGGDEKMLAAIVVAEQAVRDLPKVKAMLEAMDELNKLNASAKS